MDLIWSHKPLKLENLSYYGQREMWPLETVKGKNQPTKKKKSPLEPWERNEAPLTPWFYPRKTHVKSVKFPPNAWKYIFVLLSHQVCGDLLQKQQETNTNAKRFPF